MNRPNRSHRVIIALGVALASFAFTYIHLRYFERALGFDFTWPWRAARFILQDRNPYAEIRAIGAFPFDAPFKYPLPAALLALPVARLSAEAAAAVFGGASAGLLAYGLTERTWNRLFILLSPPFLLTLASGQWSTLLMAGALLPMISWVAVCKPTVGLAVFLYRPNRWAIFGGTALAIVSFLVLPSWFSDWIGALRRENIKHLYMAPIALLGGPVLLTTILKWRRPEARYLLAIAITPHILGFYTGFLPMLVAETKREAQVMTFASIGAYLGSTIQQGDRSFSSLAPVHAGYWLLAFLFMPALVMILRRPNEGSMPVWVERFAAHAPTWLRGYAAASRQS